MVTIFTFIDLFAGIGGIRIAFENAGAKCLFSSEWDKNAQKTYYENFGEMPKGDITKIKNEGIPKHDILLAGFPCQSFSIAGKKRGFDDVRGTMFFEIARIIKYHRPKAVFLENVKGLVSHNKGETLKTILKVLREDLEYYVPDPQILNAKDFGLAQNRERVFIVGFRKDINGERFEYPKPLNIKTTIKDIIEKETVSVKYYLSTTYLDTLEKHKKRHQKKGNGFGYQIKDLDDIANTIVLGGMGKERNLIIDKRLKDFKPITRIKGEVNRLGIRKMTPREWARLQGFPETFKISVADTHAYNQFANSVAIPAVEKVAENILKVLNEDMEEK